MFQKEKNWCSLLLFAKIITGFRPILPENILKIINQHRDLEEERNKQEPAEYTLDVAVLAQLCWSVSPTHHYDTYAQSVQRMTVHRHKSHKLWLPHDTRAPVHCSSRTTVKQIQHSQQILVMNTQSTKDKEQGEMHKISYISSSLTQTRKQIPKCTSLHSQS